MIGLEVTKTNWPVDGVITFDTATPGATPTRLNAVTGGAILFNDGADPTKLS
jgi:hypothetical protein